MRRDARRLPSEYIKDRLFFDSAVFTSEALRHLVAVFELEPDRDLDRLPVFMDISRRVIPGCRALPRWSTSSERQV